MPGFDGTGPRGMGPLTGRGMGYCAVPVSGIFPAGGYNPSFDRDAPRFYESPYPYPNPYRPQYLFRGRRIYSRGRGRGRRRW